LSIALRHAAGDSPMTILKAFKNPAWLQNAAGRITDANTNWKTIANKKASEL
jgi:hypothetical protein